MCNHKRTQVTNYRARNKFTGHEIERPTMETLGNFLGCTRANVSQSLSKDHLIRGAWEITVFKTDKPCPICTKQAKYAPMPVVGEIWKEVPGHEDLWVSNKGRVKTLHKGYEKEINTVREGNKYVHIYLHGKYEYVHRLVLLTFDPPSSPNLQVNHKDGCKYNNNIDNLEWVTAQENQLHSIEVLKKGPGIRCMDEQGNVYRSVKHAAAKTGASYTDILKVVAKKKPSTVCNRRFVRVK